MTLDDFRQSLAAAKPPAELALALAGLCVGLSRPIEDVASVWHTIGTQRPRNVGGSADLDDRQSAGDSAPAARVARTNYA